MRTALGRTGRLVTLLLLALSAWWLFLRRRTAPALPARLSAREPGAPGRLPGNVLATDAGLTQLPERPTRPADVLTADVPPGDARPADVLTADVPPGDARPADVLTADVPPGDARPADVLTADVPPGDARPADVLTADVPPGDVRPADVLTRDVPSGDEETGTQIPMPTFDEAPTMQIPAVTDDLQALRGIGPSMERMLHGLGIVSYRQLAMLDGAELERVRGELHDFRSRIEREDWVGQARELHRRKYGTDPV